MNRDKVAHLEKTIVLHLLWAFNEGHEEVRFDALADDPDNYPESKPPTLGFFLQQWRKAIKE